jgi:hypothetical protein
MTNDPSFAQGTLRWLLAGFPVMGVQFVTLWAYLLVLPYEIAFWVNVISTAPVTYFIWLKVRDFKR